MSLLHDVANYRDSMPTKVIENLAHGVPVLSTPLPIPAHVVQALGGGVLVPFGNVEDVVALVSRWSADPGLAAALGRRGYGHVREHDDSGRRLQPSSR